MPTSLSRNRTNDTNNHAQERMPVVEEENTAPRPAASTGRNLKQDEYWRSLERSFNNDFLKVARWNYMRAHQSLDEIPMAELTEDGTPILPEGWEDD